MKSISLLASLVALSTVCLAVGCGSSDDKDTTPTGGSGGQGATAGAKPSGDAGDKSQGGNAGDDENGLAGAGGSEEGGSAGAGGGGDTPDAPKAILCPEPNPYSTSKLLKSSVVIDDAVLQEDAHWTADKTYLIFDSFALDNHVLTVDPGTIICLSNQAQILVGRGGNSPGEIHLNGTAEKPVTITAFTSAEDPTKPEGPHLGIKLDTYQASTLSYVNIWYGGAASWAFELTDTARNDRTKDDPTKPLLIDHLTIGEVQTRGLRIGPEIGVDPKSSIRFTGFGELTGDSPDPDALAEVNVFAEQSVAGVLEYDKATIPEVAQRFRLKTGAPPLIIDKDVELADPGVPLWYDESNILHVSGQEADAVATLTIDAGVTLKMRAEMEIGDTHEGNLVINGTAAKPVIITSKEDEPSAGDWEGIIFSSNRFDPAVSKINYAQILYAGISTDDPLQANQHVAQCGTQHLGAILVGGTQATGYAGPTITNTLIAHSLSDGIASDSGDNGVHLTTSYKDAKLKLTFQDIGGDDIATDPCQ